MVNSSQVGDSFKQILLSRDIQPGDEPSYQICKLLYEFHPVCKKMVDLAPKFYPLVSSLLAFGFPCRAV